MAYLIANNVKIIFFYTSKKELYLSMDLHYMWKWNIENKKPASRIIFNGYKN